MKYYIYDIDKPGIKEFDYLNEAMKIFINTKLESSYTALGITKPSRAIDIIVKERADGEVVLRLSKDFLSSSMYKDNRKERIFEIRKMTKSLKFSNRVLDKILEEENITNLKNIKTDFNTGVDPTFLMNKIEEDFKIPVINDPHYNSQNKDVMELYRKISASRKFEELDEEIEI